MRTLLRVLIPLGWVVSNFNPTQGHCQILDSLQTQQDSIASQSLHKGLTTLLAAPLLQGRERVSFWPPKYKPYRRLVFVSRLDFRHSFINKDDVPVIIYGANFGMRFRSRHEFYAGYYTLTNNSRNQYSQRINRVTVNNEESSDLNLWFISLGYAYSFIKTRWFDINLPLEIGFGNSTTNTFIKTIGPQGQTVATKTNTNRENFWPLQLGIFCELRFCRWLSATGSVGYRIVLDKHENQVDYESLYYAYGAKIYIGQVVRDIKLLGKRNAHVRDLRKGPEVD